MGEGEGVFLPQATVSLRSLLLVRDDSGPTTEPFLDDD